MPHAHPARTLVLAHLAAYLPDLLALPVFCQPISLQQQERLPTSERLAMPVCSFMIFL